MFKNSTPSLSSQPVLYRNEINLGNNYLCFCFSDDGRTKPIPKNVKEPPAPAEYKCLFRAKWGNKKIATVVNAKDVNKFQLVIH